MLLTCCLAQILKDKGHGLANLIITVLVSNTRSGFSQGLRPAGRRDSASPVLSTWPSPSPLAGSFDRSEPVHGAVVGVLASNHLATRFAQTGSGRPHGMRQPTQPLPDLRGGSAFGSLQQTDQLRALCTGQLRALCTGWWLLSTTHTGRPQIGVRYGFGA